MTLDLINTFKTKIILQTTQTIPTYIFKHTTFQLSIFSKNRHPCESSFFAHFYGQTGNYCFNCFNFSLFKLFPDIMPIALMSSSLSLAAIFTSGVVTSPCRDIASMHSLESSCQKACTFGISDGRHLCPSLAHGPCTGRVTIA